MVVSAIILHKNGWYMDYKLTIAGNLLQAEYATQGFAFTGQQLCIHVYIYTHIYVTVYMYIYIYIHTHQ